MDIKEEWKDIINIIILKNRLFPLPEHFYLFKIYIIVTTISFLRHILNYLSLKNIYFNQRLKLWQIVGYIGLILPLIFVFNY